MKTPNERELIWQHLSRTAVYLSVPVKCYFNQIKSLVCCQLIPRDISHYLSTTNPSILYFNISYISQVQCHSTSDHQRRDVTALQWFRKKEGRLLSLSAIYSSFYCCCFKTLEHKQQFQKIWILPVREWCID